MSEHEFYQRVALMAAGSAASCLFLAGGLVFLWARMHQRLTRLEQSESEEHPWKPS